MPTLTERVTKLETEQTRISTTLNERLNSIASRLEENARTLHKLDEEQERQALLIQSINQSRKSDKRLFAFLFSILGGLAGYIIKGLL